MSPSAAKKAISRDTRTILCVPRYETSLIHECLVNELTELGTDGVCARRQELGEEQRCDLLGGIDPEGGAGRPAPGQLAGAGQDLVLHGIVDHREAQAEAHTVEGG